MYCFVTEKLRRNITLYTHNLTKDEIDPEPAIIEVTDVNEKVMRKIRVKSSKLTDNSTYVRDKFRLISTLTLR